MANNNTDKTILNAVKTAGVSQDLIDTLSHSNLSEIGNIITSQPALLNEFTSVLVEKVALTIFSNKMINNPLARFKQGKVDVGGFLEEIWVDEAQGSDFDREGSDSLKRTKPSVKVAYHNFTREYFYTVSISQAQVMRAFNTAGGITSLLNAVIMSLYNGDAIDEFKIMKQLIGSYEGAKKQTIAEVTDAETAKALVKTIKQYVLDLSFPNSEFNEQGVTTFTPSADLEIFMHKKIVPILDTELLATAFNMSKLEINERMTIVDDFGTNTNARVVIADKNALVIKDRLYQVETMRNGKGLFTNYFLHHHQLLSVSPFSQWIEFTVA